MKEDRKTRYTRMVLRDSLMELMKNKPITKITITELCKKADINRSTFYAHYTDQHDLLRKIEDDTLLWLKDAIVNVLGKTDKSETIAVMEKICQYFVENSQHLQILMSEQGDVDFQKELFILIYEQCGIASSILTYTGLDIDEDYFIFIINGSVGLMHHWLRNGFTKSAKEMAETIYDMASPPAAT
ncbi:MAG: TetR-like C-terminal domain-containing protein [Bacillota bacterium]|jgi:AcrR family transcriptional regulator